MGCTFVYRKCRCKGEIWKCKAIQPPKAVLDSDICHSREDWMECSLYIKRMEELRGYL